MNYRRSDSGGEAGRLFDDLTSRFSPESVFMDVSGIDIYLGKAGPYAGAADPRVLLAERIESCVSQEHAQWSSLQQPTAKTQKSSDE